MISKEYLQRRTLKTPGGMRRTWRALRLMKRLCTLLKGLDLCKAHESDGFFPYLLKECAITLDRLLGMLLKKSLEEGEVPRDWNQRICVPILKERYQEITLNDRPVYLTSMVCKTLEIILRKQRHGYLQRRSYLYEKQHEFREKRACVKNLLDVYDRVNSV